MQIGFLGWREPCEQRGKCTKNTYQQTSPLPSHQQEFSSLLGSFFSTHILSDWSKINRLFKPVFSLCRGLETSHSYHTHAAADGASTSVWPALRQAHRGEEKSCIIKAREWLWSIKKKKKKKGAYDQGGLHQLCVQEGKKVIQHLFSSNPCSLAPWRGLRSLWDGR